MFRIFRKIAEIPVILINAFHSFLHSHHVLAKKNNFKYANKIPLNPIPSPIQKTLRPPATFIQRLRSKCHPHLEY